MNHQESSDTALIAARFVNQTNKNIFLTGKAGTGKTTFLKGIIRNTHKKIVVAAPTGIAAINAGGTTLHSLFQLPFGGFVPQNITINPEANIHTPFSLMSRNRLNKQKRRLLFEMELLVIDEVSMLRADLLDAIDVVLKSVRKNSKPFGGVQVLFIGDLFQLPPVVKEAEWQYLKSFYKGPYFFDAQVLKKDPPVLLELNKIYRQQDDRFIQLLNNLRNNQINEDDVKLLNKYYQPSFRAENASGYITITTHNNKANEINTSILKSLKTYAHTLPALIEGEFNEFLYPVEKDMELRVGAQVMFVKNDTAKRFFNGKIGAIVSIEEDHINVKCGEEDTIAVYKHTWENMRYKLNNRNNEIEEEIIGRFIQYPLKLAWAITVHKSQGLTFDKAVIDIGKAFAPGQIYVALSRLRSMDGLILTSLLSDNGLENDENILAYSLTKKEIEESQKLLQNETISFLKNEIRDTFDFTAILRTVSFHETTFDKDDKLSPKQKYKGWSDELKSELTRLSDLGIKFSEQLISQIKPDNQSFIEPLTKRISDARQYYTPFLSNMIKTVSGLVAKVNLEKKQSNFLAELMEIQALLWVSLKKINKMEVLGLSLKDNSGFDNDKFRQQIKEFESLLPAGFNEMHELPKKRRRARDNKGIKEEKVPKINTKELTFSLYRSGKTIPEIAIERNMAVTTIEGHLAHYIEQGQLKADEFVSEEKLQIIRNTSLALNTRQLSPIKLELGDEFSYGEIRLALAGFELPIIAELVR